MAERILELKDVCQRIGLKPNTIWNYRARGMSERIPPFNDRDGRLFILESVLDRWLQERYGTTGGAR